LLTSLIPFLCLWVLMWVSLQYSYWLTLLVALPTAGFLVRLFILQHDCGHGSFFKSKSANDALGCALSVLTLTPYYRWRKNHAVHHATSGDLDRRGYGDVHMLTVAEYQKLSSLQRLVYRVHRHPVILFGIAPFLYFVVFQRFAFYEPLSWKKERANVYWTNLALLVGLLIMAWLIGLKQFLLVHLPIAAIASSAGVWIFYVQHHFESAYWRRRESWDYFDAGTAGSSYYQLPALLQWFTANIGLHHIHHLDSRIPNYNLQKCFDENPALQRVHRLTILQSLSCTSLKLWDEERAEMVGFPKLDRADAGPLTEQRPHVMETPENPQRAETG
jgi:omega-6 fatty acid desaturase (delta-12 desaturase)